MFSWPPRQFPRVLPWLEAFLGGKGGGRLSISNVQLSLDCARDVARESRRQEGNEGGSKEASDGTEVKRQACRIDEQVENR